MYIDTGAFGEERKFALHIIYMCYSIAENSTREIQYNYIKLKEKFGKMSKKIDLE